MKFYFIILLFTLVLSADAQNSHSLNPIQDYEIMFQTSLWFRVDMRQKINSPFFAQGHEFSKILIDAVKKGQITPYLNDSLTTRMDKNTFLQNISFKIVEDEEEFLDQDNWKEIKKSEDSLMEYTSQQLYLFEMKEHLIFDRRRSKMYHDILTITLVIPAENTPTGIEKDIGTFSYKELVEQVFKNKDNEGRAIWYNHQNAAEHHNLADAFTLRLFNGRLVKTQNARNLRFDEIYNDPRKALIASDKALHKLIEYESLLWEY